MNERGQAAPNWAFRKLKWGQSAIHGEIPMELSIPFRAALPRHFLAAGFCVVPRVRFEPVVRVRQVLIQDERASVSEIDFRGFPACAGALVPEFGRVGREFVFVGWNPGADGLPRWFDGLKGLIRPPRLAGSPCGLRVDFASLALRAAYRQSVSASSTRLRPKRLRSLGVFRYRTVALGVAEG